MTESGQFLGKGWCFPPTFDNQGRSVRMVEAEEDIRQSLMILLSTTLGERIMRPNFGWKREALVFEALSTSFSTLLKREVESAVLFFEPRIELNRVRFEEQPGTGGRVDLRLEYTIRATNSRSNLVFPFYRDEATNA